APGEGGIDHPALWRAGGAVALVEGEIGLRMAQPIAEMRIAPEKRAFEPFGVGLDQQLVGIEALSLLRAVRAVHPIAVEKTRPRLGKVTVPDLVRALAQIDSLHLAPAARVEQAELHLVGVGREKREIDTLPIPGGPARVGVAGPDGSEPLRLPGFWVRSGTGGVAPAGRRWVHGTPRSSPGEPEEAMEGNADPVRTVPELVAQLVEGFVDLEQAEEGLRLLQRLVEARGGRDLVVTGEEGTTCLLLPGLQLRLPARAVVTALHRAPLQGGVPRIREGAQHAGHVGQR